MEDHKQLENIRGDTQKILVAVGKINQWQTDHVGSQDKQDVVNASRLNSHTERLKFLEGWRSKLIGLTIAVPLFLTILFFVVRSLS